MSLTQRNYIYDSNTYPIYIFVDDSGNSWFKVLEVAKLMGYSHSYEALNHVDMADQIEWHQLTALSADWSPRTVFVNESGLYKLLCERNMGSLRHWFSHEAIPSVRREFQITVHRIMSEYSLWMQLLFPPQEDTNSGHVYVATTDLYRLEGIFMIGSTVNLKMRLASLNSSRPDHDLVYYVFNRYFSERHTAITAIHAVLDQYRPFKNRELFVVPNVDVIKNEIFK